jgi:chromosome segregation ATPase
MTESFDIKQLTQELRQTRDELRLKMHLASMEISEEWEEAQKRFEELEGNLSRVSDDAKEAGKDLLCNLEPLAKDIKKAFERIKNQIQE